MLDTDALRTFIAVAERGSFTKAGEQIGRTQSAVSMQIKKLEEQLGLEIIIRENKGVRLTHEGEMLLDKGRQIIRLTNEAVSALLQPDLSGLVRMGIPDDYAESYLPPLLRSLAQTHPNIEFELVTQSSEQLLIKLDQGDVDLAFVTSGLGGADNIIVRSEPLIWVKAVDTDVDFQNPIPLATFGRECPWCRFLISHLDQHNVPYRITYSSSSYAGFSGSIMAGLAISILPLSALKPGMEVINHSSPIRPVAFATSISLEQRSGLPRHIALIRDHIASLMTRFEPPVDIENGRIIARRGPNILTAN